MSCDTFIPPSTNILVECRNRISYFYSDQMEEEEMEDVSLDEKEGKEEKKEVAEKKKVMEEVEGVEMKEDQVLAALGNIGRWQVQIIMITGYICLKVSFVYL